MDRLTSPYNYLNLLSMLYLTSLLSSAVLFYKPILLLSSFAIVGSDLSFPLSFAFGDIVAEIFGYNCARKLVILAFICLLIFTFLKFIVIHLPYPKYWHNQASFEMVLGLGWRYIIATSLAVIISELANIYIISKWKILVQGKYFWIRNIGSTICAQIINTVIFFPIVFFDIIPMTKLIFIMISAFVFKIIYAFFAAFPATIIVNVLKKNSKHVNKFYPFKTELNTDIEYKKGAQK